MERKSPQANHPPEEKPMQPPKVQANAIQQEDHQQLPPLVEGYLRVNDCKQESQSACQKLIQDRPNKNSRVEDATCPMKEMAQKQFVIASQSKYGVAESKKVYEPEKVEESVELEKPEEPEESEESEESEEPEEPGEPEELEELEEPEEPWPVPLPLIPFEPEPEPEPPAEPVIPGFFGGEEGKDALGIDEDGNQSKG